MMIHGEHTTAHDGPVHPPAVSRRAFSWLLVLPFLFFATHGRFWFDGTGDARSGAGYLLFAVVYGVVLWAVFTRVRQVAALAWEMPAITVLALFTIASLFWSQDPSRSLQNGVFYLLDTLFAFYLVSAYSVEELMSLCMLAGAIAGLLSIVLVAAMPSIGLAGYARAPGAWRGVFQDRNTLAMFTVFFLSPAISLGRKGWTYKRALYILLMLVLVTKAEAVTAFLVLAAYTAFLLTYRGLQRVGPRSASVIAFIVIPCCSLGAYLLATHTADILLALGRDPTLTGRTEIWQALFRSITKRPLLGYGFYSFWLGVSGESANEIVHSNWVFGYAHNGVLEVVLQLGLAGLLLFAAIFARGVKDAWICFRHRDRSPATEWLISLLALTAFYNISEETIVWPNDILTILLLAACTGLALAAREVRTTEPVRLRILHDLSLAG